MILITAVIGIARSLYFYINLYTTLLILNASLAAKCIGFVSSTLIL